MPHLDRRESVWVIDLGDGENRINPTWSAEMTALLDEVAAAPSPKALVTAASGKFFSNGLDTSWGDGDDAAFTEVRASVNPVLLRLVTLPAITVAAIQGHAFAAGALFTLAHDFRVMRADRGFWCLPEVDLKLVFPPSSTALARAKLSPLVARTALLTGRRYGGGDAVTAGIVDEALNDDELLPRAIELAASLAGKADPALGAIKEQLYADVVATLT